MKKRIRPKFTENSNINIKKMADTLRGIDNFIPEKTEHFVTPTPTISPIFEPIIPPQEPYNTMLDVMAVLCGCSGFVIAGMFLMKVIDK